MPRSLSLTMSAVRRANSQKGRSPVCSAANRKSRNGASVAWYRVCSSSGVNDCSRGCAGGFLSPRTGLATPWPASEALAVGVVEGHALFGAGQGIVPAVSLLPVPGGTVGLAAAALASHDEDLRGER